jgi:hypothetical protein
MRSGSLIFWNVVYGAMESGPSIRGACSESCRISFQRDSEKRIVK